MTRSILASLVGLGAIHATVDASCAAMAFSAISGQPDSYESFWYWFLAYNSIAFGLQSLFGLATDRWRAPRLAGVLGCGITALVVLIFGLAPLFALCVGAVDNALFHIGGGCISLNLTPKQATAPGIFVVPGALRLTLVTEWT